MSNQEILRIAMVQSAVDLCAKVGDFEKSPEEIEVRFAQGTRCF